jgi:hypothetical protein
VVGGIPHQVDVGIGDLEHREHQGAAEQGAGLQLNFEAADACQLAVSDPGGVRNNDAVDHRMRMEGQEMQLETVVDPHARVQMR